MRSSGCSTLSRKRDIATTPDRTGPRPPPDVCDGVPGPPSIVLVDDDWIVLSRLREIIEQNLGFAVAAACRCADGAMLAIERYRPAVVIIDVRLPCLDGVQLIRDITAISGAYVIVYTTALPEEGIVSVLRSGAKAIVFKDQPASVLVSCVRQVFTAPEVLTAETSSNMSVLTRREQEVAECAAAGARNKDIAWQLGISEGTVKFYLFHAYRKLGVGNRVGLMLRLRGTTILVPGLTFFGLTIIC
jgi:two-component system, NarL family, nitrate/nitrite response regulator NarL